MNFFDYILIGIVGLSMVLSLWRGFVREIISLIGLVAAFLVSARFSYMAGDFLSQWISNPTFADVAGFALIFIVIMIIVGIVGSIIRKLVGMADLTATDRTLGIFFGAARGILLIGLCFLVFTSYNKTADTPWLKQSLLTPHAVSLGDLLGKTIPEGFPFSRQGKVMHTSPQTPKPDVTASDNIPVKDQQALKAIIENSRR